MRTVTTRMTASVFPSTRTGEKSGAGMGLPGNLIGLCRPEQSHEKEDAGRDSPMPMTPRTACSDRRTGWKSQEAVCLRPVWKYLQGDQRKGNGNRETDEEDASGNSTPTTMRDGLWRARIPVRVEDGKALYRLTRYRYDKVGNRTEEKRYNDYQTKESAAGTVLHHPL